MVRELVRLWLEKNCLPQLQIPEFLGQIDAAHERNQNCWLRFGRETTKDGIAWLIYCYGSEFFAFALNQRQESLLRLKSNEILIGYSGVRIDFPVNRSPATTLKPPEIILATPERIAGSVQYEMLDYQTFEYRLQMTWDRRDGASVTQYHYPVGPLLPSGKIQFDFQLTDPNAPPTGPSSTVAFFALQCPVFANMPFNRNPNARPISDTHAVLVELK